MNYMQSILFPRGIVSCFILVLQVFYPAECAGQKSSAVSGVDIALSAGPNVDEFNWSIAGFANDATYVNVLSELKWQYIKSHSLSLGVRYCLKGKVFLVATFQKAFIHSGIATDTDYQQQNRNDVVYHASFDSDEGSLVRVGLSAGYRFNLLRVFSITPFAGYSNTGQNLFILQDKTTGKKDLRSTYQTNWKGLMLGVETETRIGSKTKMLMGITYHQTRYSASADWNLVETFQHPVSFTHHANGFGLTPELTIQYALTSVLDIFLNGQIGYWKTGKGRDTLYLQDGHALATQLNGVKRTSKGISIGVSVSLSKIIHSASSRR